LEASRQASWLTKNVNSFSKEAAHRGYLLKYEIKKVEKQTFELRAAIVKMVW
jgi:hypothetical protein